MSAGSAGTSVAALKQQVFAKQKKVLKRKGSPKLTHLSTYAGVFLLIVTLVALGYQPPKQVDGSVAHAAPISTSALTEEEVAPSVDELLANGIAGDLSQRANLPLAGDIKEISDTLSLKAELAQDGETTITKPSIIQLEASSREIRSYTVQAGDTAPSVAAAHGISATTLKWANNLTSDALIAGTKLSIPPVDGIVYTAKAGDTIDSLAQKYGIDKEQLIAYNDLEISGLTPDKKLILPGAQLPTNERPGYVAPVARYSSNGYLGSGFISGVGIWSGQVLSMRTFTGVDSNSGGYARGNCTAWAFYRRAQLGRPIPGDLGNAYAWAQAARGRYQVDKSPEAGAVIQAGSHVGVVEEVLPNGDLRITDMNYGYRVYNLAERIIPASTVHNYMFIH